MKGVVPLLEQNLQAPWLDELYASDSSLEGAAHSEKVSWQCHHSVARVSFMRGGGSRGRRSRRPPGRGRVRVASVTSPALYPSNCDTRVHVRGAADPTSPVPSPDLSESDTLQTGGTLRPEQQLPGDLNKQFPFTGAPPCCIPSRVPHSAG